MNDIITRPNTFDIYDEGVRLLTEHMGIVKAETFIATVIREQFDYTKWRRNMVDATTKDQFHEWARENEQNNPYAGKPETVI